MVLQRDQENPVWGWGEPGESVVVRIAGQTHATEADSGGAWKVHLDPMSAGGPFRMRIRGEETTVVYEDILVGEVWVCSGQSNMQWPVNAGNDPDLEKLTANFPEIRLITVPQVGTQERQKDFSGAWTPCSPNSVGDFSAVGYYFGRRLHQTLDVPVGLIDNAWGGSAVESWISRDLLEANADYSALMDRWEASEAEEEPAKAMADYEAALREWNAANAKAKAAGEAAPPSPRRSGGRLSGQHRPGNLFNGVLYPIIGYGIRGAIWYQGESNASRAYQYRNLFPTMIRQWRDLWGQGKFPFYWVQLADFRDEVSEPTDSDWAELREAQTMTLDRLDHTGQAVIIDLGEAHDIHPKNKQDVAKRLARLALAQDYGLDIVARSPRYESMTVESGVALLKFKDVGSGLDTFDIRTPIGFTIAGEDRQFVPANAEIVDAETIKVSAESVPDPVAVRYGWADNPICNVQNKEGLPLTPFRTDAWPGVTAGAH